MENWRDVVGYEGIYEVSDQGRVRRKGAPKCLEPYIRAGYPAVSFRDGARKSTRAVHSVVLEAFVGPRPADRYGAHLDGNVLNPALSNLRWVTQAENEAHKLLHGTAPTGERSAHAKLTNEQAAIAREIAALGYSQRKIAILAGIGEQSLSRIIRGETYRS